MKEYFQFLNQYYEKIYVLTVEAAVARRELFTERFRGLNYTFFFGADKNKFSIDEVKEKGVYSEELTRHHHRYSKTMNPGEIACSWSHKLIYEDMLANNYNRILVFEDDAIPDPAMAKQIHAILQEIPDDCELLLWAWDKNGATTLFAKFKQFIYKIQHSMGKLKWDYRFISHLHAKPYSKHLKKAGFHDHTVAYAVNVSGAIKLLKMQTPIQYIADNLLAHAAAKGILKSYITWPQVFLDDSLPDGTPRDSYVRLTR
jgi:glycosyl transferase, family 25